VETIEDRCEKIRLRFKAMGGWTPVNKVYFQKHIIYGNYIDITTYKTIRFSFKNEIKSFNRPHEEYFIKYLYHDELLYIKERPPKTSRSLLRSAQNLYRLALSNSDHFRTHSTIFATLKYHRNEQDLSLAYRDFKLFIQKLKYHYNIPIRYVAIPEFQKRGAIHFHCIFFDMPFLPVKHVELLWGHGSHNQGVDWQIAKHIKATGSYLIKYLRKGFDDPRFIGYRLLLTSRNLIRPSQSFSHHDLSNHLKQRKITLLKTYQNERIKQDNIYAKLC